MGGKTQRGWIGSTVEGKGRAVMGVQKGVSETEIQLTLAFLGAGLLAYVIIPGMLVTWDRVLDHMDGGEEDKKV
jgi:hypothetical protein